MLKGLVLRNFRCLQMILIDRIQQGSLMFRWRFFYVCTVKYLFLNFCFNIVFKIKVLSGLSFYYCTQQKLSGRPATHLGSNLKLQGRSWRQYNASLAITLASEFSSWCRTSSPGYCTCWGPLSWWAVKAGECSY